jgi:hypothetical protein
MRSSDSNPLEALALTASLALATLLASACTETPQGTSLLLITIDTLRADHVSAYGYPRPTTPSIDRLASEGVLWRNAIAPRSETWPSVTSVMTSRYPQAHGVRSNGDLRREGIRTMAEHLHGAGFSTAAFLTNMTTAEHPGFDHIEKWGVGFSLLGRIPAVMSGALGVASLAIAGEVGTRHETFA